MCNMCNMSTVCVRYEECMCVREDAFVLVCPRLCVYSYYDILHLCVRRLRLANTNQCAVNKPNIQQFGQVCHTYSTVTGSTCDPFGKVDVYAVLALHTPVCLL